MTDQAPGPLGAGKRFGALACACGCSVDSSVQCSDHAEMDRLRAALDAERAKVRELNQEVARYASIHAVSQCRTVDAFLELDDAHKRLWFAAAVDDSERRKQAEAALATVRQDTIEECATLVTRGCWTHGPDVGVDVKIASAIRSLASARPVAPDGAPWEVTLVLNGQPIPIDVVDPSEQLVALLRRAWAEAGIAERYMQDTRWHFKRRDGTEVDHEMTVREFGEEWLFVHLGVGLCEARPGADSAEGK